METILFDSTFMKKSGSMNPLLPSPLLPSPAAAAAAAATTVEHTRKKFVCQCVSFLLLCFTSSYLYHVILVLFCCIPIHVFPSHGATAVQILSFEGSTILAVSNEAGVDGMFQTDSDQGFLIFCHANPLWIVDETC
eukprot:TRINITY_DN5270_c1_g1_i1.p1 TRINITY_DN5270_c1_g1~~TRINITY_DN5270_c1_g1_i1.p1  ORF type:complete len:136 (-),score=20.98 TRINITY_DN5270_c1_g1_i1:23-430(-)